MITSLIFYSILKSCFRLIIVTIFIFYKNSANFTKKSNLITLLSNYQLVTVIADFFNVSTDFLLNRTSDPTPPKRSEEDQLGDSILSHFRLNTADMEVEDIEELEEELNEYMDFLVQRAKAKKNKK